MMATDQLRAIAQHWPLARMMREAAALRDAGHGELVSYSRKVFVPLTRLCRDVCHYCTFARSPQLGEPAYLSVSDVLEIAAAGKRAGCREVLFTLGDKPELRYRAARAWLHRQGFASTIDYLAHVADQVFRETGLFPHVNPGVMTAGNIAQLRKVAVSQGLMLETSTARLSQRGGPHFGSPDKDPAQRLATLRMAGEARVPFTTGILVGIGETRAERLDALLTLRDLHRRYGHVQEIIIQNFRAKPGTRMAQSPDASFDELRWTIALARLVFGPDMHIQAPPNLSFARFSELIGAGLDDWGGVSPVTPDHVNPEAAWPQIKALELAAWNHGKVLVERLASYPEYVAAPRVAAWHDARFVAPLLRATDGSGLARTDRWVAGTGIAIADPTPAVNGPRSAPAPWRGEQVQRWLDRAAAGQRLDVGQIATLFAARGATVDSIVTAADELRRAVNGDRVTYVVNRNINYTNICRYNCRFCAFSKGTQKALRGRPYDLDLAEIVRRARETWARGGTEVCLQGGIHPQYTGDTYLAICRAVKAAVPEIHVHAFSPLEVAQGAATLNWPVAEFLSALKTAGLNSLPGTAAEILDDEVRAALCPDKLSTSLWLSVVASAHRLGLKTTATIMFGHVDGPHDWARHLLAIRDLQAETGGFTELVPLPFVHMEAPIYCKGLARKGPTWRETVLMHAVARLVLHPVIGNIQASWVKLGSAGAARLLGAGVNDLGGTLMNESISRAAGTTHGQELSPRELEQLIRAERREPVQRTTAYGQPPARQTARSHAAAQLAPSYEPAPRPHGAARLAGDRVAAAGQGSTALAHGPMRAALDGRYREGLGDAQR